MDEKTLAKTLSDHQKERQLIDCRLPVIIGRMEKDHFQNNFRQGNFANGGFTPWPTTQRQKSGSAAACYDRSSLWCALFLIQVFLLFEGAMRAW